MDKGNEQCVASSEGNVDLISPMILCIVGKGYVLRGWFTAVASIKHCAATNTCADLLRIAFAQFTTGHGQ